MPLQVILFTCAVEVVALWLAYICGRKAAQAVYLRAQLRQQLKEKTYVQHLTQTVADMPRDVVYQRLRNIGRQ